MGVPADQIAAALALAEPKREAQRDIEVEPENRDAVRLFRRMLTQWRVETVVAGRVAVTIRHGLDKTVLPGIAAGIDIKLTDAVWDGLEAMEGEALTIFARREQAALRGS